MCEDLLTPIIAALVKKPDFSAFSVEVNGAKFPYGDFINALISFLLIAAAVYYFVVLPVNHLMKRFEKQALPDKEEVPGVPERYSAGRAALRVLRAAGGGRRGGSSAAWFFTTEARNPRNSVFPSRPFGLTQCQATQSCAASGATW